MIKKILTIILVICFLIAAAETGWLLFEYKHPYLCEYYYIKDNKRGISHECGKTKQGKYCQTDITTVIDVDNWKYKCGRK